MTVPGPASPPGLDHPRRLLAPEPTWDARVDVVVVGTGVAGLACALQLSRAGRSVALLTKTVLASGSTWWAQGGIAAALAPGDSPAAHYADTIAAGGGLCDPEAVQVLVTEGPARVRGLVDLGARFDELAAGGLALTREGGHAVDRVAHAGGDATGEEISRALVTALEALPADAAVTIHEQTVVLDVLTDGDGRACGVAAWDARGAGTVRARAVVLATGGIGQVFRSTTNPPESTGDGAALALRAGADLADMEFVQFHPTVLWLGDAAAGQQTLISEAVRGEGAVLVDARGRRFMPDADPRAELAPRDIVARAVVERMAATGEDCVYLDARGLGAERVARRFPTVAARLAEHGLDLAGDLVPVAPAAHYHSGGVRTDLVGRSTVDGLYAVGEAACTGVHGANRLASNSLLEGLVFAARLGDDVAARLDAGSLTPGDPGRDRRLATVVPAVARAAVQRAASAGPGAVRDAEGLAAAAGALARARRAGPAVGAGAPGPADWEATNLWQVAAVLTETSARREESRGGHLRRDHPRPEARWRLRQRARLRPDGGLDVGDEPVPPGPGSPAVARSDAAARTPAPVAGP